MRNHLNEHQLRHQELVKYAKHLRLATELRRVSADPNTVIAELGNLIVEVGELFPRITNPQKELVSESIPNLVNPNSISERTQS